MSSDMFQLVTIPLLVLGAHLTVTTGIKDGSIYHYHLSVAEMYYANVAGAITGGFDMYSMPSNYTCPHLTVEERRYRQVDGTCNNRFGYGTTFKPVKRLMKAHYQDAWGRDHPRIFSVKDGSELPSPRSVSLAMHPQRSRKDRHTVLVMQLGQLLDHDISSAPVPTETNSSIMCCGLPKAQVPHECFPIKLPARDPNFSSRCMEFVRSEPAHDADGEIIYPREQLNVLTSFVDGSCFYGSDKATNKQLRTHDGKGALLKTHVVNGEERLPEDGDSDCLAAHTSSSYCQLAGDRRVNEHPYLGSIHLLFHLYHNHIVRALVRGLERRKGVEPSTRSIDNFLKNAPEHIQHKLYQEARKIHGGIWQKIVYCDWLPIILGPHLIRKFQLGCSTVSQYNPNADPRIANAFLTAAFRFGHSLIPNTMQINYQQKELKKMFMIPDNSLNYYNSNLEGMCEAGSQEAADRFVSSAVTTHLFETVKGREGALDLVSLNIQRGRDHGIPGYYYWRKFYHLQGVESFQDLGVMSRFLSRLYKHITDVDLFPAGLIEKPVPFGIVGPTFGHIIAHQFADLKFGDKFFFLSRDRHFGFTPAQLAVIRSVSMAKVMCQCSHMKQVQRNPFFQRTKSNPHVSCSSLSAEMDVTPWIEDW